MDLTPKHGLFYKQDKKDTPRLTRTFFQVIIVITTTLLLADQQTIVISSSGDPLLRSRWFRHHKGHHQPLSPHRHIHRLPWQCSKIACLFHQFPRRRTLRVFRSLMEMRSYSANYLWTPTRLLWVSKHQGTTAWSPPKQCFMLIV